MNSGDIVKYISTGELMIVVSACSGSKSCSENFLKVAGKDGRIHPVESTMFYAEHAFELIFSIEDKNK